MLLRAILAFLALPALVAGLLPLLLSQLPSPDVFRSDRGVAMMVAGLVILLVSVVSFYRRGRGTLAPWDPPVRLVVGDLYRFNRNPMYVGVVTILSGWALLAGNLWNYLYAALVPLLFHLRVVLVEEREMERRFGDEWEDYRRAVPRWGVSFRPYRTRHDLCEHRDATKS